MLVGHVVLRELLGTIQSELAMGKPVIDRLGQSRSDPNAGSAPGDVRTPAVSKAAAAKPAARVMR